MKFTNQAKTRLIVLILFLCCSFYKKAEPTKEAVSIIKQHYIQDLSEEKIIENAVSGIFNNLDEFSSFISSDDIASLQENLSGEFVGIGVEVRKKDTNSPIEVMAIMKNSPAYSSNLKTNDLIIKIEGKSVSGMKLTDAVKMIRGKPNTIVNISIYRLSENKEFELKIKREKIKRKSVEYKKENDLFYIQINNFNQNTYKEFEQSITEFEKIKSNTQYLLLDVRDNPGGLLDSVVSVCELFLNKDEKIVSIRGRNEISLGDFKSKKEARIKFKNIAVLINENSASASEILAACLKDNNKAILIGQKTYGKGSVQEIINLTQPKNSAVRITIAKYYTPKNICIDKIGISPDFEIKNIKNIKDVLKYFNQTKLENKI